IELLRTIENRLAIPFVGERPSYCQRAGHSCEERRRLLSALLRGCPRHVLFHPPNMLAQRVQKWCARTFRSARDLSGEGGHGTSPRDIIAVIRIEIGLDKRLHLLSFGRALDRRNRSVAGFLQRLFESLGNENFLAAKMPIEATVRQVEIPHQ